jgi:Tfp pilus assembly protein PilF
MERIEKLKEFLKASPEDSFLQHALALEYVKIDNDAEAKKLFTTILERDPNYVGSYYHLGKLLERIHEIPLAITTYENGMAAAKKAGDNHSYNELQGAYEDITD